MLELEALIEKANDLEPLPVSVTRLAGLVSSDDSSVDEIAEVVAFDQGLTAKLLRFANSAMAAGREPLTTVNSAIIRLGLGQVLEVAIASSVRRKLDVSIPEYGIEEGLFWRHSVTTALAAESMSSILRRRIPPESFTAALLHDVGKLVLSRFLDPERLEYLNRAREEGGRNPLEAEAEILGVHHAELGGLVCQHWQMPDPIVNGVMHHHTPEVGEAEACDVVHAANMVAHHVDDPEAWPVAEAFGAIDPGAAARIGLEESHFVELGARVRSRLDEVLDRFGLLAD